jgi:hypothetical protein
MADTLIPPGWQPLVWLVLLERTPVLLLDLPIVSAPLAKEMACSDDRALDCVPRCSGSNSGASEALHRPSMPIAHGGRQDRDW